MSIARVGKHTLMAAAALAAICGGIVWATPPSGTTSTLVGRATYGEAVKVKRMGEDGFKVKVDAAPALDIAVQKIVFNPDANSGWHSHPGPVFISVIEGTITFYESDDPTCTPTVRHAGEGFVDVGDHAHMARNETSEPATTVVTYLVPPAALLRIDEPSPGNCPF